MDARTDAEIRDAGQCAVDSLGQPIVALDELCKHGYCPADRPEAETMLEDDGGPGCMLTRSSCCGVDTIKRDCLTTWDYWSFDSRTGQLVGATLGHDTPWDLVGCSAFSFSAGTPAPECGNGQQAPCDFDAG